MSNTNKNTAVLFFSRSAEEEAREKSFTDQQQGQDQKIARRLIDHSRRQIAKTGLPYFVIDESAQRGNSFGERFANAFADIFDHGYEHVIAVGNDTPQLSADDIIEAANQLKSGYDMALGPANDGGVWLAGYSRSAFYNQNVARLSWQSSHLLDDILKSVAPQYEIYSLQSLGDIDNPTDLHHVIAASPVAIRLLIDQLQSILASLSVYILDKATTIRLSYFASLNAMRAPPLM